MASVKSRADKVLKICGVQDKTYRNGIVNTAKALLKMDNVEIIAHRAPDGDTLGSAYALCRGMRSLGKKANVVCADNIPEKYAFMQADMESQSFEPAHFVSVDIAAPHLMGKLAEAYENKIEICIDHHMGNSINAPMKLVEEDAAATGEIIWILLEAMGAQIDKATASCLFAAISTDTGCFKYSNVTPRTHLIAVELMKHDIECADLNFKLIDEESKAKMELKKMALSTLEFCCDDKCAIITITSDMMEQTHAALEDTDGVASIPRSISGVECGITMKEIADGWKISIRSTEKVNASELCSKFGGGGHAAAAGCKFDLPYEDAKKQLIDAVSEVLGK